MRLETERLVLRSLERCDAEALFSYRSRPDVQRYQCWRPKALSEVEEFIAEMESAVPGKPGTWLQLAVCLKDGGRMIGDVGMHFPEDDSSYSEIGYTLDPNFQQKGYATEAVHAVMDYLFRSLEKHRVTASVDPRNTPSASLLERLGFRLEAHFIKSFRMDGEWCDDCVYAMLQEEWRAD